MATYADGTTEAMIGDVVECIHGDDLCGLIYGWSYVATPATEDQVFLKGRDNEVWKSSRFKLISRAPSPAKAEPLVKWPEESEELGSLKWGTLFVLVAQPDVPCVARSHGDYVPISGERAGTILTKSKSAKVRRIQFNPANKEPVFIVI